MSAFRLLVAFICCAALVPTSYAEQGYQTPSPELAALVDAKLAPTSYLSSDGQWLALFERKRVVTLDELAKEELKLAGIKLNPANFSRSRVSAKFSAVELKHVQSGSVISINNLPNGIIRSPKWSSNSQYLAFIVEQPAQANLWLYSVETKQAKELTSAALNSVLTASPYKWLPDSSAIVANLAVNFGKPRLENNSQNVVPVIQQSTGEKAPARTYQNLLTSPFDESQFKFYGQGQLAYVTLDGNTQAIGSPSLFKSFSVSPDSTNILVAGINEPFSYQVPYSRFASTWQIWGMRGYALAELAKQPLADNIPQGYDSVRTGRRNFEWRADQGAEVIWAEAQDGGDMKTDVEHHDYVYSLRAPFKREPKLFAKVERRYAGMEWGNENVAMLTDWRFSDRQVRTYIVQPRNADRNRVLFSERSYNDAYKDPGNAIYERNDLGANVIKIVGGRYIYLRGNGASEQGNVPFLDQYDVKTNSSKRLWQSEAPYYERVRALLDDEGERFITIRESKTEQPNFFIRNLDNDTLTQLTTFEHPYPAFKGVTKEQLRYKRDDGVELSGTLYLPPGYDKTQGPLPVLMWAYPLEYKDKAVASQVRESPYAFTYIGYWGPMPYLAKGIAVFDDPKMPIVGIDGSEPNDNFRKQLVSSAQAAVDVLVKKGIADKNKIAIAGHSYGAFMVANLLAHSDLFKTGIARSGAYNRTLTPFGFQGEERDFWQAQSVYANMSPFFHAEKINEPMLMIHGQEDPNSGTFPMQSERMYAALKGLGKDARLVMLPYEAHGYRARKSLLHVLWEQEQWLDKYLLSDTAEPIKATSEQVTELTPSK
ncbi:MAG TPA: S9 family peptidase [Pseudoalteromonas sp.]|uniref:Peptidase S9 prolyl oligopeptidase catalytic domain-containing protein n=1 Tax=marine sediment metagenome TaxID=412755 RepID=A0A0F9L301_9ZZZZ|nr:prolyl oligopeptidase family serine peptidase [Pseudoalteromonas sp.]HDY91295.1 S9 family peptidase [Pseudoalteromonas sp.]HDZ33737.1 S9 family peptidase [Pseudoalteromonas sp.]